MSETVQFGLPLVQAAQAQKHVTVNEALARLDCAAQMRLQSVSVSTPPVAPFDGTAYGVPVGSVNAWEGKAGMVAVASNGGWVYFTPQKGWCAWIVESGTSAVYDGAQWRNDALAISSGGAATLHRIVEIDHIVNAGATSQTANIIPNGSQVVGVTGRVLQQITGAGLTGWELGVSGSANRYGSGLSLVQNSWIRGLSGAPVTYWSDTPLVLNATGGSFASGSVRLAVHLVELVSPDAI